MVATTSADSLEVVDFSGGMTDFYLGAATNKYQLADNFLILKHGQMGKLFTRPGSEIYDDTNYRIPSNQRINGIRYFLNELFTLSARKLYYVSGTWQTLQGPSGNDLFPTGADVNTLVSWYEWNKHLFVTNELFPKVAKIYKDSGGVRRLRTAGLPRPANAPTLASAGGAGQNYIYRIIYKYEYESGTLTFIDRGPYEEAQILNVDFPNVNNITVSNIPVLANGATDHYDTASANLVVEIYRTITNGTTFYYVASVTNGTTSYVDSMSDTTLQTQPLLYTEGGVPENDPPPLCKYLHIMDDKGYYAHTKEGSEVNPTRVYQSIPGDIDSVPATFFVDVQDEIVGISSVTSNIVVFCLDIIYRLDGSYDALGQGFIVPQKISDTAGCVNHNSIVQTVMGTFWAGNDGFYYTDSYRVFKVSSEIDDTYKDLVSTSARKAKIQGRYDARKLRVWWTVQSVNDNSENDMCFVLDLNWGISPSMPFTTVSGSTNFAPTFIEFITGNLIRADKRGYVFIHRDTLFSDPRIDTSVVPSSWTEATIIYNYVSMATNFGTSSTTKYVTRLLLECANETNLSLQPVSINDDGRIEANLSPIRYRNNLIWGEPDVYWGDPTLVWGNQGLIVQQRRFPAKNLRCQYKQIKFTNANVAIVSSDLLGTALVNASAKTATLTNLATVDWPSGAVDFYIAFEADGFSREYLITARTDDVITFDDPLGLVSNAGASRWVMRGKPKNEILQLISYTIDFILFGKTSEMFRKSSTGEPT